MQSKYTAKLFSGVNCGELWEFCGVLSDQLVLDTAECVRDGAGAASGQELHYVSRPLNKVSL